MHVAGVAKEEQAHGFGSDPKPCCVRELNTGTATDTLNATKGKKIHPQYSGVAIYLSDVPAFPQPRPLLLHFPISNCACPRVLSSTEGMSTAYTCLLQLVRATDTVLRKISKGRLKAVVAALEILRHSLCL